jgi:hypothetical protein
MRAGISNIKRKFSDRCGLKPSKNLLVLSSNYSQPPLPGKPIIVGTQNAKLKTLKLKTLNSHLRRIRQPLRHVRRACGRARRRDLHDRARA